MIFLEEIYDDNLNEAFLNESDLSIPKKTKQFYNSKKNRRIIKEKYGNKAFLDPSGLKYPILDPTTGKVDCHLVYAARARASQLHKEDIKKAAKLFKENKCEIVLKVHLH